MFSPKPHFCVYFFLFFCWIISSYFKEGQSQPTTNKRQNWPRSISFQSLATLIAGGQERGTGPDLCQKAAQRAKRWVEELTSLLTKEKDISSKKFTVKWISFTIKTIGWNSLKKKLQQSTNCREGGRGAPSSYLDDQNKYLH